jgi:hypothetical protein
LKDTQKRSHYLKLKAFKQSPSLAHLGDDELWEIADLATHRRFAKGVLFTGKPRWVSAQAMDEVTLLCIRREAFLSFVTRHM